MNAAATLAYAYRISPAEVYTLPADMIAAMVTVLDEVAAAHHTQAGG